MVHHMCMHLNYFTLTPYSAKRDVRPCTAISSGNSCGQLRCNFTKHSAYHREGGVGADRHLCGELSAV